MRNYRRKNWKAWDRRVCPPADLLVWEGLGNDTCGLIRDATINGHVFSAANECRKLVIEFDLPADDLLSDLDNERINAAAKAGYKLLRISSSDVYRDINSVCIAVKCALGITSQKRSARPGITYYFQSAPSK